MNVDWQFIIYWYVPENLSIFRFIHVVKEEIFKIHFTFRKVQMTLWSLEDTGALSLLLFVAISDFDWIIINII